MGQGHSSSSNSKCVSYKNTINTLNKELATTKNTLSSIENKLQEEEGNNKAIRSKLDQLSSICMVDKNNLNLEKDDLERAGKKIYNMLSNKYRENIQILETQQSLMNRQNRLDGIKGIKLSEQKNKLKQLTDKIQKNDRLLMYDKQENNGQNKMINILKVTGILLLVIVLIFVVIKIFLKYRK